MCPVVLLALLFSFILFILELTAAINVTFNPLKLKNLKEGTEESVNFYAKSARLPPAEALYKVISNDPNIASVTNFTFNVSDEKSINGSFVVKGNFLGNTYIQIIREENGTFKDRSSPLEVSVIQVKGILTKVFTISVAVLVSLNQINMGCAMDLNVVKGVLCKPIAPLIGFASQYVIMPLAAYIFARFLINDVILQLGLFTFGCSPGGGASNMWTVLLKGNLNLSLTMTFLSSLAALGMMPLWLFTLGRSLFSQIETKVPFGRILLTLVIMLVTLGIGLAFQKFLPRVAKFCRRILAPISVVMILYIIIFGTYANLYMFKLFTLNMMIAATATVWLGFLCGALISKAFDLPLEDLVTIAIETGVQNTGIAIVLLGVSLDPPESDLASVVPVAASIATPFPLLGIYLIIKIRERYFPKKKHNDFYIVDDEEKKALPTLNSSDFVVSRSTSRDSY